MHVSYHTTLAIAALLAASDLGAPAPAPSSPRSPSVASPEPGLILAVDQGERRMRRVAGGAPFIIKVDRLNGGSPDLVMGYEVLPPGHVIPPHRHPHADEILFVQYGRGVAELDGRSTPVGPGGTVYIPHDVRVSLRVGPDSLGLVFIFSRSGFEQYLREVSVLAGQPVVPLSGAELKAIRERNQSHVVYEQP